MISDELLIVYASQVGPRWRAVADAALADWPGDNAPAVRPIPAEQLLDHTESFEGPTMAWVFTDTETSVMDLYQLLDQLGAAHLPVLLTRFGETEPVGAGFQAGAIIAPPDAPAEELRLMIQAMVVQAETISQLKHELRVTRMHHGGLRGQMDRLDEELRLAAEVQREFLPTEMPQVGQIHVDCLFRPAGYVSGDIYDAVRLDEDHIGFWLADIVGHGVPAALMTMFIKRALPTKRIGQAGYKLISPDEALATLNHELVNRQTGGARFATAVYGTLNCRTLELKLARAGHPQPILLKANGETELLEADGPLLGVFDGESFDLDTRQLDMGDRLILFSDGFELAFSQGDEKFDTDQYRTEFKDLRYGTPEDALWRLQEKIDAQPGSLHQRDDLTAMLIAVGNPNPTEAELAIEKSDQAPVKA